MVVEWEDFTHTTGTKTARERNRGFQAVERDVQRRGARSSTTQSTGIEARDRDRHEGPPGSHAPRRPRPVD
jgi:hypothetical protein